MTVLDIVLYFSYVLLGLTATAAIILPVINAAKAPKTMVKSGLAFAGMVIVFLIAYALSSNEISQAGQASSQTGFAMKMIGAGMLTFYIILILAVLGLVYSEINKALK